MRFLKTIAQCDASENLEKWRRLRNYIEFNRRQCLYFISTSEIAASMEEFLLHRIVGFGRDGRNNIVPVRGHLLLVYSFNYSNYLIEQNQVV